MSDKLLVEIDLYNGEIDDAVPALIYLTNELFESGVFEVTNPIKWNEKQGNSYQVKWRFAEDDFSQAQISLDIDFLFQLNDTLKRVTQNIPENSDNAIENMQKRIERLLENSRINLFAESY